MNITYEFSVSGLTHDAANTIMLQTISMIEEAGGNVIMAEWSEDDPTEDVENEILEKEAPAE